jgi:serine/threonine protein phosphatase 1
MTTTYAIGDIHGRLDPLTAAMDHIHAHAAGRPHRIIFLGDYIDRGPESRGVIEFLMAAERTGPITCLKGNHEALMLGALRRPDGGALPRWLRNGGDATLRSYGTDAHDLSAVPQEHLNWLARLPFLIHDDHRIYVHAGVTPGIPLDRQDEDACLWIREPFLRAPPAAFDRHVVHGHTPTWAGKPDPSEPELLPHRSNLDTGAYFTGVLTVGIFDDDLPGGPVSTLRVEGPSHD